MVSEYIDQNTQTHTDTHTYRLCDHICQLGCSARVPNTEFSLLSFLHISCLLQLSAIWTCTDIIQSVCVLGAAVQGFLWMWCVWREPGRWCLEKHSAESCTDQEDMEQRVSVESTGLRAHKGDTAVFPPVGPFYQYIYEKEIAVIISYKYVKCQCYRRAQLNTKVGLVHCRTMTIKIL